MQGTDRFCLLNRISLYFMMIWYGVRAYIYILDRGVLILVGAPFPFRDFGHVNAMFIDVIFVDGQLLLHFLSDVSGRPANIKIGAVTRQFLRNHVANVLDQVEAVDSVQHAHVKGRGDGPFFAIALYQEVLVGAAKDQMVDHLWVGMEIENDWLGRGEDAIVCEIGQSVRVSLGRVQPHQINHVDEPDL